MNFVEEVLEAMKNSGLQFNKTDTTSLCGHWLVYPSRDKRLWELDVYPNRATLHIADYEYWDKLKGGFTSCAVPATSIVINSLDKLEEWIEIINFTVNAYNFLYPNT